MSNQDVKKPSKGYTHYSSSRDDKSPRHRDMDIAPEFIAPPLSTRHKDSDSEKVPFILTQFLNSLEWMSNFMCRKSSPQQGHT